MNQNAKNVIKVSFGTGDIYVSDVKENILSGQSALRKDL